MTASISVREYMKWDGEPSSEPTATLVLTSPEHRFVDIRTLLQPNGTARSDKLGVDVLHLDQLDWAIAGTSSSAIRTDPNGNQICHSTWSHWIDSRSREPESVTDEGDMFPQHDGKTLERGAMVNPATGKVTDYEECWLSLEPTTTSEDEGGKRVCVVLVLEDEEHEARGMVVSLGQFCQGFLRVGEYLGVERWAWEKEGGWRRLVRMGDLWVPCGTVLEWREWEVGGEVRHGEYIWKVVERVEF